MASSLEWFTEGNEIFLSLDNVVSLLGDLRQKCLDDFNYAGAEILYCVQSSLSQAFLSDMST